MDKTRTLQNLLDGTAAEDEINLFKQALANGEISIGGNVNQSVIIIGSGNTVEEITSKVLDSLRARPLLGNLDRELTAEEIASGLRRLDKLCIRSGICDGNILTVKPDHSVVAISWYQAESYRD